MNLPIFQALKENQSTYITFSKALYDLDKATDSDKEYFFSKAVFFNLPDWKSNNSEDDPGIYIPNEDLQTLQLDIKEQSPVYLLPKILQYYTENLIRHGVEADTAFLKTLRKLGMSTKNIQDSIVAYNGIFTNTFVESENNLGWSEIVVQLPNFIDNCRYPSETPFVNSNPNESTIITKYPSEPGIYDSEDEKVWNFNNGDTDLSFNLQDMIYDKNDKTSRKKSFNCILLFYADNSCIEITKEGPKVVKHKLHGINFIIPYEQPSPERYELPRLDFETNNANTRGYQFIFNMKSVNNSVSETVWQNNNEQIFYKNQFSKVLGQLDRILLLHHKDFINEIF